MPIWRSCRCLSDRDRSSDFFTDWVIIRTCTFEERGAALPLVDCLINAASEFRMSYLMGLVPFRKEPALDFPFAQLALQLILNCTKQEITMPVLTHLMAAGNMAREAYLKCAIVREFVSIVLEGSRVAYEMRIILNAYLGISFLERMPEPQ